MKDITLLDGSIGQELVKRAGKKPKAMWSTAVLIDQPNLVLSLIHISEPTRR